MIHIYKASVEARNLIKEGKKNFDLRVLDEKAKKVRKGDFLAFVPQTDNGGEPITVFVIDIVYASNFAILQSVANSYHLNSGFESPEQAAEGMKKYYTLKPSDEVVGFVVKYVKNDEMVLKYRQ